MPERNPPSDARGEPAPGSGASPFDHLFQHLPATIWMTDERMALTFIEGVLIRNLNVEVGRLIGRTLPDLLLDGREDHPLIQAHIAALGGHETTVRVEWGGNLYSARVAPLRDTVGRVVGCAGIQQLIGWLPDDDLTVRENEVRLQRIIDWNIVGIAFGDDQGRITDANEAFLQITGYAREDVDTDGISWPALMPVEFHQRQVQALDEILATGRCTPFESEILRPDGRRVAVVVGAARLSARRREGVAFVVDVSPYRRIEGWVRAELAVADAFAESPALETAVATVLQVLCEALGWAGAWIWTSAQGDLRPLAHHGTVRFKHSAIAALAAATAATGESTWSADLAALVLPLTSEGRVLGAIVLIDHTTDGPEQPRVAATRAIVGRLAKFLGRIGNQEV